MTINRLRTRGAKIIAAMVCALAVAIPASLAISAPVAHAATCTATQDSAGQWDVPYGCNNVVIPGSHRCTQIDDVGGIYLSDECADIVAENIAGHEQLWGQGEFYCQGVETQCAGLNVTVDMSWKWDDGFESATTNPATFQCNPSVGSCVASGRNYVRTARSNDLTGVDFPCATAYSWLPYDGWHGHNQVIALKGVLGGADHVGFEWDSGNVNVCFGQ